MLVHRRLAGLRHREAAPLLVGFLLVAGAAGYRGWFAARGWFEFDDVVFLTRVNGRPLSPELLFEGYGGHLMPGGFLFTWLFGHDGSLDYAPYAATLVALQALAGLGLLALLRSLFGSTWLVLVPLALYLTSSTSMPGFLWWAAGVNQLPLQISLGWGLLAHLQYLRTRRLRWLAATAAVLVGSLFFYEKVLLVYGAIAILTVGYFTTGPWRERVRQLWTDYRPGLLVHVGCGAGYLLAYVLLALNFGSGGAAGQSVLGVAGNLVGRGVVPALLGGPLQWSPLTGPFQVVDPPAAFTMGAWLALAALVVHLHSRRNRSLRAWLLPLWFVVCDVLLLGAARATAMGSIVGLELRYVTELPMAFAIALGLAALPVRGARESAAPREERPSLGPPEYVGGATVVVCLLGLVSGWQYASHWVSDDQTRAYFANADDTLGTPRDPSPLVNTAVPQYIMWGYDYPANTIEHVLHSFAPRMSFPAIRVDSIGVIGDDGRVTPAVVVPLARSAPASGPCGYPATAAHPGRVPMPDPPAGEDWWVRLSYRATAPTDAEISVGATRYRLDLPDGLHNVYFHVGNQMHDIRVATPRARGSVCLYDADAGYAVPFGSTGGQA